MFKRVSLIFLIAAAILGSVLLCANHNWHPLEMDVKADRVLIEKRARTLTLFSGVKPIKTYSVALGREPVGRKNQEGDGRTPEGSYTIDSRNPASGYHRALHISYPDKRDQADAAKRGLSPGGDVMIHGIVNGYGRIGAFHRSRDWTSGCIAVTDFEIDEIWRAVPDGTEIEIRP